MCVCVSHRYDGRTDKWYFLSTRVHPCVHTQTCVCMYVHAHGGRYIEPVPGTDFSTLHWVQRVCQPVACVVWLLGFHLTVLCLFTENFLPWWLGHVALALMLEGLGLYGLWTHYVEGQVREVLGEAQLRLEAPLRVGRTCRLQFTQQFVGPSKPVVSVSIQLEEFVTTKNSKSKTSTTTRWKHRFPVLANKPLDKGWHAASLTLPDTCHASGPNNSYPRYRWVLTVFTQVQHLSTRYEYSRVFPVAVLGQTVTPEQDALVLGAMGLGQHGDLLATKKKKKKKTNAKRPHKADDSDLDSGSLDSGTACNSEKED
jgi:hypothetical protein